MVPKSRTRVVEPAAPRAPGRTLPPAPANKDKTSWPGMLLRPRYSLPPETKWQRPCKRLSRSMGRYDGTAMWNFGELFAAMRPARTLKFADGTRPSQSPHAGRAELQANRASRMICRSENRSSPIPHRRELSPDRRELARQPLHVVALSGDMSPNRRHLVRSGRFAAGAAGMICKRAPSTCRRSSKSTTRRPLVPTPNERVPGTKHLSHPR
jgi:hypothetical protein